MKKKVGNGNVYEEDIGKDVKIIVNLVIHDGDTDSDHKDGEEDEDGLWRFAGGNAGEHASVVDEAVVRAVVRSVRAKFACEILIEIQRLAE